MLIDNGYLRHRSGGWESKLRAPMWSSEGPLLGPRLLIAPPHDRKGVGDL